MQIAILRECDVQLFPDADARAQARVGLGLAAPLCLSYSVYVAEIKDDSIAFTMFEALYTC